MMAFTTLVTGLGDAALVLPAATVLLLYLVRVGSFRAAAAWTAALGLSIGLTALAKMTFHVCGDQFPGLAVASPSGHASLSATFYGCGALALSADQSWSRRIGALLAGAVLVVAIAMSRVALHAHTVEEVAIGLAIGLFCVSLYAFSYLPRAISALGWRVPVGVVIVLALFTHGHHLNFEGFLDRLADRLQLAQHLCPLAEDAGLKIRTTTVSTAF